MKAKMPKMCAHQAILSKVCKALNESPSSNGTKKLAHRKISCFYAFPVN
jgi:hypothetical protein